MKTPEEIKKGLECCATDECHGEHSECPYNTGSIFCIQHTCADALAYIRQFERERDAAVKDMQMIVETDNCKCETCGHCAFDEEDESRICANCDVETYSNWRWRGAPVEE